MVDLDNSSGIGRDFEDTYSTIRDEMYDGVYINIGLGLGGSCRGNGDGDYWIIDDQVERRLTVFRLCRCSKRKSFK